MTPPHLSRWEVHIRRVGSPSEIIVVEAHTLVEAQKKASAIANEKKGAFKIIAVVQTPGYSDEYEEQEDGDGA